MSEVCIHELHRCAVCDEPEERAADSRTFTARYDGICRGCGFDIKVGESVHYVSDALRHARCA